MTRLSPGQRPQPFDPFKTRGGQRLKRLPWQPFDPFKPRGSQEGPFEGRGRLCMGLLLTREHCAKRGPTARAHDSHASHDATSHFRDAARGIAAPASLPLHCCFDLCGHWIRRSHASPSASPQRAPVPPCRCVPAPQTGSRDAWSLARLAVLNSSLLGLLDAQP